ncbi:hypothetical protein DSECCO2_540710 [anaerobic digester metagenome]
MPASQIPMMPNPAGAEAIGRRSPVSPYQRPTRNGAQDTSAMKRNMSPSSGAMATNWLFVAENTPIPESAGRRRFLRRSIIAPGADRRDRRPQDGEIALSGI